MSRIALPRAAAFPALFLSLCLAACFGGAFALRPALAQPGPGGGGPPEAAFTACASSAQGASCSFAAPRGRISGVCRDMGEPRLVCVPDGAGPGRMSQGGRAPAGGRGQGGQGPAGAAGRAGAPRGADIAPDRPDAIMVKSRIPDTNQGTCFNDGAAIPCPSPGEPYFGQDASYVGAQPAYRDDGDGTVRDLVTGLTWQKAHHDERLGYYQAKAQCEALTLGGHDDWRLPSIKELFSLADFRGSQGKRPYIDDVFEFREPGAGTLEGDPFASTHYTGMMGQTWSSTIYTGVHFGRPGVEAAFFFNFLDGHIKQAPTSGASKLFYRCVRGPGYGENRLKDLGDGTVRDEASGLVWQKTDDGKTRDWKAALAYCQDLRLGGGGGWRLPNVKELQSIVDYSRHDPALSEPTLSMTDAQGWFWSSTTHGDNILMAAYVCFGPCVSVDGVDTHGAGAQRADPKSGAPGAAGPLGGQRDESRVDNYVRCVR